MNAFIGRRSCGGVPDARGRQTSGGHQASSDRSFGLVIATFFLIVTFWPLVHAKPVRWWALGVAAVFAVLALLWTPALAPLNKLWTKLGILLYKIVSPVVLGLLFYVTVTPIALLMRLLGKDPLRLRRDPDAAQGPRAKNERSHAR